MMTFSKVIIDFLSHFRKASMKIFFYYHKTITQIEFEYQLGEMFQYQ